MWVLYLILASMVSTIFPLPPIISPADPTFIGYALTKSFIIIPIMVVSDTVFAYITYLFTDKIMKVVKRLEVFNQYALIPFTVSPKMFKLGYSILYQKKDLTPYMRKYGKWFIMVASATPLPFTLSIYAVGVSAYKNDVEFTLSVLVGRLIKYAAIYYSIRLGLNIFR